MEYNERADALEAEADDMARQSAKVGDHIDRTKSDWRQKQSDESVPGAVEEGAAAPGGEIETDEADEES